MVVKAASLSKFLAAKVARELVPGQTRLSFLFLFWYFEKSLAIENLIGAILYSYFSSSGAWILSWVFKEPNVLKFFLQNLKTKSN